MNKQNSENPAGLPPGLVLTWISVFRDGEIREIKLLLPNCGRTDYMVKACKQKAEQEYDLEIQRLQDLVLNKKADSEPKAAPPASKKSAVSDSAAERQYLQDQSLSDQLCMGDDQVPVYDWHEPLKLIESKLLTPDTDSHERNDQIFKKLKQKGHLRKLAQPVDMNEALSALETLRQSQPHFTAVLDLVRQEMLMALKRNRPLKLPPLLLNGDPGVGKTFFTQALAGVLNMPIRRHSFDSSTTESALTGSDKHWSNTSYGLVFEAVCMGEFANAIVLLDELDKASHTHNQNPTAPLHTLLEPITSSCVTDISVCLNFNASHLNWIATANNPARIAAPLRSRFIEFDIQLPTGEQALKVARAVADAVYKELDLMDFEPVPPSIVKLIAHLVPREQGQVLRRAFAGAIDNNRDHMTRMDLPADVLIDDIDATGGIATPTFLH